MFLDIGFLAHLCCTLLVVRADKALRSFFCHFSRLAQILACQCSISTLLMSSFLLGKNKQFYLPTLIMSSLKDKWDTDQTEIQTN